jgi:ribosomal protein L29
MKTKEFVKEINKKDISKLNDELTKERAKLQQLRTDLGFGKVKNYREINMTRKNIARISTVLNNKADEVIEPTNDNASKETSHGQD